jgi:hypothetical protein
MGKSRVAIVAVSVLTALGLVAPVAVQALSASTRAITAFPHVGIGIVKLKESHSAVDRALGRGVVQRRGQFAGTYKYRSGAITIYVNYGPKKLASGVNTANNNAIIYGHRLWEGQKKLVGVLHHHGWTDSVCEGLPLTELTTGGPATGIIWKRGAVHEVLVGPGSGTCLPPGQY